MPTTHTHRSLRPSPLGLARWCEAGAIVGGGIVLVLLGGCRAGSEEPAGGTTSSDTFTSGTAPMLEPDHDSDGFRGEADCDDSDPFVYPGAPERCNGIDDDCDGEIESGPIVTVDDGYSYPTISQALDAAWPGSTVVVCPGEWQEAIVLDHEVSLVSRDGAATTVLTNFSEEPVLDAQAAGRLTLKGFTLRGRAPTKGGVWMGAGSTLTASELVVTGFGRNNSGGLTVANATLTDVLVRDNGADEGGGLHLLGGDVACDGATHIVSNWAVKGGGVYVAADSSLVGCTVKDNVAEVHGGGICVAHGASLVARETVVQGNTSEGHGGGVALFGSDLTGAQIEDNEAWEQGGGLYVSGEPSDVTGVELVDNEAGEEGGGLYAVVFAGLLDAVLEGNHAPFGGGAYAAPTGVVSLVDSQVTDNTADFGAGLYVDDTQSFVHTSEVTGNEAAVAGGGVYVAFDEAFVELAVVDFADNTPTDVATSGNASLEGGGVVTVFCQADGCD